MSFQYTLGLLGLIGIPAIILIYILKNKHTEQVISSTYLWRMSERFLKRKNPISRIAGIISLVLQILAIGCISLGIAHPEITLRGAAKDYVFILDASGSMQYAEGEQTRFELGKEKIADMIDDAVNGSSYTVICAGDSTGIMLDGEQKKKQALAVLEEIQPSATSGDIASGARALAQEKFNQTPSSKIYLITDKAYEGLENVTLVNVAQNRENYAVSDLAYVYKGGGNMEISGKTISYQSARDLSLTLEIATLEGIAWTETKTISVQAGEETDFTFNAGQSSFHSITVRVNDADSLPLDNESVLYNVNSANVEGANRALIVTDNVDNALYMQTALSTLIGEQSVEVKLVRDYDMERDTGYQLYVYNNYTPERLPDGNVWFVNPTGSVPDSGFSVLQAATETAGAYYVLEYSNSTATRVAELLKDVTRSDIAVTTYQKCSFYRNFHVLLSHDGNPVVAAGTNDKGNRQAVFAFEFPKSDFVLHFDFVTLIRNLWSFTSPSMLTQTSYACGENVTVNVFSDAESVRIDTPSGQIVHLDAGSDIAEYTLTEVGTYTITQQRNSGPQTAWVYGYLPKNERYAVKENDSFVVEGTPSEEGRDGVYNDLIALLIILAAIFLADWVVYCYEQYQLR